MSRLFYGGCKRKGSKAINSSSGDYENFQIKKNNFKPHHEVISYASVLDHYKLVLTSRKERDQRDQCITDYIVSHHAPTGKKLNVFDRFLQ